MKNDHFRLDQAVPPMSDGFMKRVDMTLKEIEDMKKHPKITFTLVAAVIAALVLTTVAVAQVVESGLLARLFRNGEPGPEAAELLQTGIAAAEEGGVRLAVDELLFDGRNIICDVTLESTREGAVFAMAGVEVCGDEAGRLESENMRGMSMTTGLNDGYLCMLGEKDGVNAPKAFEGQLDINYIDALTEDAALEFTVYVFESGLTAVEDDRLYFDPEAGAKMEADGEIRLAWGHVGTLENYPSYMAAMQAAEGNGRWMEQHAAAVAASGLMQPVTEFKLSVPLVVRAENVETFGPERFALDGCTLEVKRLSFSPASMNIDLKITGMAEDMGNATQKLIVAVNGEPLKHLSIESYGETDTEGNAYEEMIVTGAPLAVTPEEISFILSGSKMTEDETIDEYYARLVREAHAGNRAVMKLK